MTSKVFIGLLFRELMGLQKLINKMAKRAVEIIAEKSASFWFKRKFSLEASLDI